MNRTSFPILGALIALLCSVATVTAEEGISDQQREKWAKGAVAYGAGRVAEGERGSGESRENAVTIETITEGAVEDQGDADADKSILDGFIDGALAGVRILGTLDAQRQAGTLATPQESGLDYVEVKGDKRFQDEAAAQGLGFEDNIDLDNGMQAMLMRHPGTGRAVIVMRGTEITAATLTENARDIAADLEGLAKSEHAIGKAQYEAARPVLHDWVDGDAGNIEVIGHSLGGALGQRLMLERAADINHATFFNTPGLEKAALKRMAEDPDLVRDLMTDGNQRKVRIYNSKDDKVSDAGNGFILGDVIMASGKSIKESPHMASVFGSDVQRKVQGYYGYANTRGMLSGAADFLGDMAGMIFGHASDATDMGDVMRSVASKEAEVRRANPETQTRVKLDGTDLTRAPLVDMLTRVSVAEKKGVSIAPKVMLPLNVDLAGDRDTTAGQTVPLKPAAPVPAPAAKGAQSEPATTGSQPAQEQDGLFGSFSGPLRSADKYSVISGGRITITVAGTRVTGTASGRNTAKSEDAETDYFRLKITGTYDPATGRIEATALGSAQGYGSMAVGIVGRGGADGFRGQFNGIVDGSWSAYP